jgi:chromosome segregation ATPase
MNRLSLLHQLDDLLAICKTCELNVCDDCKNNADIRQIGNNLTIPKKERKIVTQKEVLDQDSYKKFKAQGKTDAEISREYGIKQATLIYYKKKWFDTVSKPVTDEKKHSECNCMKDEQKAEYERLIKRLEEQVKEDTNIIQRLEAKVKELENIHAACDDIENEVSSLREEKNKLSDECGRLLEQNIEVDRKVENWKYQYKTLMDQNAELKKENLTMRELIRQWA